MTSNQRRAARLAQHILKGRTQGSALSDHDWHLLLLAGGVNKCGAPALVVAGKVMDHARRRSGYFAPRDAAARRGRPVKVAREPRISAAGAFAGRAWRGRYEACATGTAEVPVTRLQLAVAKA